MLKIKDDIDLEELGFRKDDEDFIYCDDYGICCEDDRIIWFGNMSRFLEIQHYHLDRLYDLIEMNVIEKIPY